MYLGVDQSYTACAYVVLNDHKELVDFGVISTDKEQDIYTRARFAAEQLVAVANKHNIDAMYIEGLAFNMMGNATRDLAGLLFTIRVLFSIYREYTPITEISPRAVKLNATGNGSATKTDMVNALPAHIRDKFIDAGYKKTKGLTDLADAYHIAVCTKS